MKDYILDIKIKNNLLMNALKEEDVSNHKKFCEKHGISIASFYKALALKTPLYGRQGRMLPTWIKLSKALKRLPEDLCPESHHYEGLSKNRVSIEANKEDLIPLQQRIEEKKNPEYSYLENETKRLVSQVVEKLPPKDALVIKMYYGLDEHDEHTSQQIADKFGVSPTRIMQRHSRALRVLKRPSNMAARCAYQNLKEMESV